MLPYALRQHALQGPAYGDFLSTLLGVVLCADDARSWWSRLFRRCFINPAYLNGGAGLCCVMSLIMVILTPLFALIDTPMPRLDRLVTAEAVDFHVQITTRRSTTKLGVVLHNGERWTYDIKAPHCDELKALLANPVGNIVLYGSPHTYSSRIDGALERDIWQVTHGDTVIVSYAETRVYRLGNPAIVPGIFGVSLLIFLWSGLGILLSSREARRSERGAAPPGTAPQAAGRGGNYQR